MANVTSKATCRFSYRWMSQRVETSLTSNVLVIFSLLSNYLGYLWSMDAAGVFSPSFLSSQNIFGKTQSLDLCSNGRFILNQLVQQQADCSACSQPAFESDLELYFVFDFESQYSSFFLVCCLQFCFCTCDFLLFPSFLTTLIFHLCSFICSTFIFYSCYDLCPFTCVTCVLSALSCVLPVSCLLSNHHVCPPCPHICPTIICVLSLSWTFLCFICVLFLLC